MIYNFFLIKGWTREAEHWSDDFLNELKKHYPNSNLIYLEIPGNGYLNKEKTPTSIPKIVQKMRMQYQQYEITHHVNIIIAISLGGMIAIEWMYQHSNDFDKAIIMNTSLRKVCPIYKRLLIRNIPQMTRLTLCKNVYKKESLLLEIISNNKNQIEKNKQKWGDIQSKKPVSLKNKIRQLTAAIQYKAKSYPPKNPILLLNSKNDRLVSYSCSETIHKKWNIPIKTHQTAGHNLSMDDPVWVVQHIKQWQG